MVASRQHWAFLVDSIPFTRAVIAGETALGGSESSAIGLARALIARGHQVTLYAGQLAPEAVGPDAHGLMWAPLEVFREVNTHVEYDVAVAVRIFPFFGQNVRARLRILWNHDLLAAGPMQQAAMAVAWAYDRVAYVSQYHRQQWEGLLPELAPIGWVTKNGFDPSLLPATSVTKDPNRIIHISRPERGLGPLLAMWPRIRAANPHATLQLCRYSSEYDDKPGDWGDGCRAFDAQVAAVHQAVGGIEVLGQLTKPQLYDALAQAAVLWYPGVAWFAETSCLAAIEAQACGTPIVASARGALPETAPGATLLEGDAEHDPAYQDQSVAAVLEFLDDCRSSSFRYRTLQQEGRQHAAQYSFGLVAAEWDRQVEAWFTERFEGHTIGVLRQLLQEDDHVAAKVVAEHIGRRFAGAVWMNVPAAEQQQEAAAALALCDRVIAGQEQEAEHYAANAVQDPLLEAEHSTRFKHVIPRFAGCQRVLDVACGNGAFAIALALANPRVCVAGIDYAEGNIGRAREAAVRAGVSDRVTFQCKPVYDFERQTLAPIWQESGFDGLFCGEFIEHVANHQAVIDGLETELQPGATVVYTCPNGPWSEALPHGTPNRRGHVHHFHHDDVQAVWGPKVDLQVEYLAAGHTPRGHAIGNWIIQYVAVPGDHPAGERPIDTRIRRTRPKATLSVGLIVKDGALDLPRCLSTVWPLADEIVVGDTGSTDDSTAIAAAFGARVLALPPLEDTPEGFAGARNAVLDACTGDWFLWIDADERLMHPQRLGKLLEGAVFRGYVLAQQHLYTSRPPMVDTPIRLFRRGPDIQFYGCIHEQPQQGGPNGDITPYLYPHDLQIVHLGYLAEESGLQKMLFRNLPLMRRDLEVFPDRDNGAALAVRDFVYLAKFETEQAEALTPQARHWLQLAIQLFRGSACARPAHRLHDFARPWYELALEQLGIGFEMAIALGGATGSMRGLPPIERVRVQTMDEFRDLVEAKTDDVVDQLRAVPYVTRPWCAESDRLPVQFGWTSVGATVDPVHAGVAD